MGLGSPGDDRRDTESQGDGLKLSKALFQLDETVILEFDKFLGKLRLPSPRCIHFDIDYALVV